MTFFGNFTDGRTDETSLARNLVTGYVRQLFKRDDFPQEIFIVLADSTVANKGDAVWANLDNEHPYDFSPMPCIDQLVVNLPTKDQFLRAMNVGSMEEVSADAENMFWQKYRFEFAKEAAGVKLIWV